MQKVLRLELIMDSFQWAVENGAIERDFRRWHKYWKQLGNDKGFTSVTSENGEKILPIKDFAKANHDGNAGVWGIFILPPGDYEVTHRWKRNKVKRYKLRVDKNGRSEEL